MRLLRSLLCLLVMWNQSFVLARIIEGKAMCEVVLQGNAAVSYKQLRVDIDQLIEMAWNLSQTDPELKHLVRQIAADEWSILTQEEYIGSSSCQHFKMIFSKFQAMSGHSWIRAHIQKFFTEKLDIDRASTIARNELIHETRNTLQKIELVTVPRGEYWRNRQPVSKVVLTHGMLVMSTKVTQYMWERLMIFNPSHFKGKMNNPVENITWWSAVEYANRISKQFGLKPVWDMSQIAFDGRAEEGTLIPVDAPTARRQILIDSGPRGYLPEEDSNIYESEGFRFGTRAEKRYLLHDLGRSNGDWPFGLSEEELLNYGCFTENASGSTQPVGRSAQSFKFSDTGETIYDLIGNVWEWADDYNAPQEKVSDPKGTVGYLRGNIGGSYASTLNRLRGSIFGHASIPSNHCNTLGIRLLRKAH